MAVFYLTKLAIYSIIFCHARTGDRKTGGMQDFVQSFQRLKQAPPEVLLSELHKMFLYIAKMDPDEVVAAYQTVTTTARFTGLSNDPMVEAMLEAMIVQMRALVKKSINFREAERFESVTGRAIGMFKRFSI